MPLVYIIQRPVHRDRNTGDLKEKFNFSDAERFGELVTMLDSRAHPFQPDKVVPVLRDTLANFTQEDFLLLVGNPTLIGWAMGIACFETDGIIQTLQWNQRKQVYENISVDLQFTFQDE